jgi:hypothetical protein
LYIIEYSTLDCPKRNGVFQCLLRPQPAIRYLCAVIGQNVNGFLPVLPSRQDQGPGNAAHPSVGVPGLTNNTGRVFETAIHVRLPGRNNRPPKHRRSTASAPGKPSFMKLSSPARLLGVALGAAETSAGTQHGGIQRPPAAAFPRRRHRGLKGGMGGRMKCVAPTKRRMMRMTMAAPPGKACDERTAGPARPPSRPPTARPTTPAYCQNGELFGGHLYGFRDVSLTWAQAGAAAESEERCQKKAHLGDPPLARRERGDPGLFRPPGGEALPVDGARLSSPGTITRGSPEKGSTTRPSRVCLAHPTNHATSLGTTRRRTGTKYGSTGAAPFFNLLLWSSTAMVGWSRGGNGGGHLALAREHIPTMHP